MKILKLPRLRLGELQTVAESSLKICKDLSELAPEVAVAKASFAAFKKARIKGKASGKQKSKLDLKRDNLISGFMSDVFAEEKFPNEDETIIAALADLSKIVRKYGIKIARLPLNQETPTIDNLLTEIGRIDLTPLIPTGVPRWIPVIKAANEEFKQASQGYLSATTEQMETVSATKLAPVLENDLNNMYAKHFAAIKVNPTDALKKAYKKLEILINSVK